MEIHWSDFDQLDDVHREVIEDQLFELARKHPNLIDVRIVVSPGVGRTCRSREVRITSLSRGQQIIATHEGSDLPQALKYLVEAIERELAQRS